MKIDIISAAVFVFCLGVFVTLAVEIKSSHKVIQTGLVADSH